jgi:hypothetical protein
MTKGKEGLFSDLVDEIKRLDYGDSVRLDELRRCIPEKLRRMSINESYVADFLNVQFTPSGYFAKNKDAKEMWELGKRQWTNILNTIDNGIRGPSIFADLEQGKGRHSERIFIVHGHDSRMLLSVERWIRKLGIEPIILHQQPDQGRTIIEKIEAYSDVGFAIVLLSPDDEGRRMKTQVKFKPRVRQNVILELGYFIGKLGRDKVHAIYREQKDLELPSDFLGVLYTPFKKAKDWQSKIARELEAAGYSTDKNKLSK